jgi:hypothetical protein
MFDIVKIRIDRQGVATLTIAVDDASDDGFSVQATASCTWERGEPVVAVICANDGEMALAIAEDAGVIDRLEGEYREWARDNTSGDKKGGW